MKKKLFTSLALAICLAPFAIHAQQDPMVSQYMFSSHFINPAYAGTHDFANITLLGRKQWVGFNGSPLTSFLSFDMPIETKNIGVGALLSIDRIGVTERTEAAGTFAYHLRLGEKAHLSFGLKGGVSYYRAKLTDLVVWDHNDQVFVNDINGKTLPVVGAGLYFYTERFYAGLSIPNVINFKPGTILNTTVNDAPLLERHYIGTIGYAIPAGKNLDIKPAILLKYVPNAPLQADLNLSFFFYKTLWVGAAYRTGDGLLGMFQYQATKNLRVGYSYDMAISKLQNYNSGSHEIMFAWDFVKVETLHYKSPRYF
ncbi:MAG: type IX secretion system membrane protein PorP/SprF [Bacteroidetes bacterium]|nr:type IX secretion system membrane protein PorP/SprF [Bacteroidota bacterium]